MGVQCRVSATCDNRQAPRLVEHLERIMPDLSSGTVSFLLTDIEGSTALWERDAGVKRTAVSRHDALLVDAVVANRGVLYKHVGDAVQSACSTVVAALTAAVAAQRARTAAAGVQTWLVPITQV